MTALRASLSFSMATAERMTGTHVNDGGWRPVSLGSALAKEEEERPFRIPSLFVGTYFAGQFSTSTP